MSSQAKAQQASQTPTGKPTGNILKDAEVVMFDIFGTVVDWRTSVTKEIQELGQKYGVGALFFVCHFLHRLLIYIAYLG